MVQWKEQRQTGQSGRPEFQAQLCPKLAMGELGKVSLPLQSSAFNSKMEMMPIFKVALRLQQENKYAMHNTA